MSSVSLIVAPFRMLVEAGLVHGCIGEPAGWLADANVGSCRAIQVESVFGMQRQSLFASALCVAIDIQGGGRLFGEESTELVVHGFSCLFPFLASSAGLICKGSDVVVTRPECS